MIVRGRRRKVRNDNEKGYSPFSTSNNWITRYDCGAWRARRVKEETPRRRRKKRGNVKEENEEVRKNQVLDGRNTRARVKYEGAIDIGTKRSRKEKRWRKGKFVTGKEKEIRYESRKSTVI